MRARLLLMPCVLRDGPGQTIREKAKKAQGVKTEAGRQVDLSRIPWWFPGGLATLASYQTMRLSAFRLKLAQRRRIRAGLVASLLTGPSGW